MTWDDIKSNLEKLKNPKIANNFRSFIYERENLTVSDGSLANWVSGKFNPNGKYTLLLKEFFQNNL